MLVEAEGMDGAATAVELYLAGDGNVDAVHILVAAKGSGTDPELGRRHGLLTALQAIPVPRGKCPRVAMPANRDRLRRTRDSRYEVGVFIERDKYARYVAKVLVTYDREGVSQVAMAMPPAPNFDMAAKAGHSWALEHIPAVYQFPQEDLVITLLDGPEFGRWRCRDD